MSTFNRRLKRKGKSKSQKLMKKAFTLSKFALELHQDKKSERDKIRSLWEGPINQTTYNNLESDDCYKRQISSFWNINQDLVRLPKIKYKPPEFFIKELSESILTAYLPSEPMLLERYFRPLKKAKKKAARDKEINYLKQRFGDDWEHYVPMFLQMKKEKAEVGKDEKKIVISKERQVKNDKLKTFQRHSDIDYIKTFARRKVASLANKIHGCWNLPKLRTTRRHRQSLFREGTAPLIQR